MNERGVKPMKKCSEECVPACDFCVHFDGEGQCELLNTDTSHGDFCEDFHCFKNKSEPFTEQEGKQP